MPVHVIETSPAEQAVALADARRLPARFDAVGVELGRANAFSQALAVETRASGRAALTVP